MIGREGQVAHVERESRHFSWCSIFIALPEPIRTSTRSVLGFSHVRVVL